MSRGTEKAPADEFTLYRSAGSVLICTVSGEIELSRNAAMRLAAELTPKLGAQRPNQRWTDEERADLRHDYGAGMPMRDIAARFGRTINSLRMEINRLGLPNRYPKIGAATRARQRVRSVS